MSIFEYIKNEMTIEEFASFIICISITYSTESGFFDNEILDSLEYCIKQKYLCENNNRLKNIVKELQKEI